MVDGGHGGQRSQSTNECIAFLAQAFPRLGRDLISDVLKQQAYDVGESLNVLEDLAQQGEPSKKDAQRGAALDCGAPSGSGSASESGWQVVGGAEGETADDAGWQVVERKTSRSSKPFAQTLKESKPPLRGHRQQQRRRSSTNTNKGIRCYRRWWSQIDETNVRSVFLLSTATTSRKSLAQQNQTEGQERNKVESKDGDKKLNFLTDAFGGEVAPCIIMDVLGFCSQDTEKAVQILMRMLVDSGSASFGPSLENPTQTGGDDSGDTEREAMMEFAVRSLQESFPQVEEKVLINVIDAVAGDLEEAHSLLCLEYEEERQPSKGNTSQQQQDHLPTRMREMLAEGPVEGNQQQANISNISASWTEVVNHSKHKKLVKDLHTLFPDCDGEFLEDVYMSMEKDMDKTIEYLTQSMNLIMSSKASKILPRDSAVLPRPKPADSSSSSKAQSSKGDADLHYTECRENAERFDAMMRVCFEQASLAFSSGNGKAAKELSNQGKQYLVQRNEWQRKAAQQTCAKMNSERTSYFPLDMHGLRVDEGLQILKELIKSLAKVPGKKTLHIITGQGKHSQGGVGKLKISIEAFLDERNLYYTVPDHNPGELYIYLDKGRKYIS